MYVYERDPTVLQVIVTNVGFNNVHDNNLVSKVLDYTAGFILCGKAGSSTTLNRNLMLTCHIEDSHLFLKFSPLSTKCTHFDKSDCQILPWCE